MNLYYWAGSLYLLAIYGLPVLALLVIRKKKREAKEPFYEMLAVLHERLDEIKSSGDVFARWGGSIARGAAAVGSAVVTAAAVGGAMAAGSSFGSLGGKAAESLGAGAIKDFGDPMEAAADRWRHLGKRNTQIEVESAITQCEIAIYDVDLKYRPYKIGAWLALAGAWYFQDSLWYLF